jgi:aspartyl-tRNA(Asn)/glutamyl-tRNA(Gln) amidotransferase subunit A
MEETPGSYGPDVRASLERGMKIPAVDYINAQNSRPVLMSEFSSSMADFDLIALPTTSITAPLQGQEAVEVGGSVTQVRTALIRHTLPFNVVGFPALSVPAGLHQGLPVGVQLVAGPFEEAKLLRVAHALEQRFPHPEITRTV